MEEKKKYRKSRGTSKLIPLPIITEVRKMISGTRSRYSDSRYNLDLTYVNQQVIAMGLPSEGLESYYRNDIEEVSQFLRERHGENYKVWNLSERDYDVGKFPEVVITRGWRDHYACPFRLLIHLTDEVDEYLKADKECAAVIHCKAGKGRTGTVICCLLLKRREYQTVVGVMKYFYEKRSGVSDPVDGVNRPSQIRSLNYYNQYLELKKKHEKTEKEEFEFDFLQPVLLDKLEIINNRTGEFVSGCEKGNLSLRVVRTFCDDENIYQVKYETFEEFRKCEVEKKSDKSRNKITFFFNDFEVRGDMLVEGLMNQKKQVFRFQFLSSFHTDAKPLHMKQREIDTLFNKKKHEGIEMILYFKKA